MGAFSSHFFCACFFLNGHKHARRKTEILLKKYSPRCKNQVLVNNVNQLRSLPTVAINGHDLRSWLMYGLASIVNMLIVNMLNAAIVNMLIDSFIFFIFLLVILAINCYCLSINNKDMKG
jgi:hypothetical protein